MVNLESVVVVVMNVSLFGGSEIIYTPILSY